MGERAEWLNPPMQPPGLQDGVCVQGLWMLLHVCKGRQQAVKLCVCFYTQGNETLVFVCVQSYTTSHDRFPCMLTMPAQT